MKLKVVVVFEELKKPQYKVFSYIYILSFMLFLSLSVHSYRFMKLE
jgi:hypothetical membrane protein